METYVSWFLAGVLAVWMTYMIGAGLLNDICDCVKDYDGWWRVEFWQREFQKDKEKKLLSRDTKYRETIYVDVFNTFSKQNLYFP